MQIKPLLDEKVDLLDEVANLEAKAWVAEEYMKEVRLTRDAEITEVVEGRRKRQ